MSENISGHLIYFIPLRCKIFAAYKEGGMFLYAIRSGTNVVQRWCKVITKYPYLQRRH